MVCLVYKNIFLLKFFSWNVLAEKSISVHKPFLSLNISDLVFFYLKMANPVWKRSPPLFPSNPPLKMEILSSPIFENLVGGSPQQYGGRWGEGGSTLWFSGYSNYCYKIIKNNYIEAPKCSVYCMPTLHISMEDFERYLNMCF